MTEQEFIERFEKEKDIYLAWGNYVTQSVISKLKEQVDTQVFLKLPVMPRVKEINSLVQKAFYRNKNYNDPYNDITDKVGLRFVVLLLDDVRSISHLVETEDWYSSKDKDFEKERLDFPNEFTYQSVHHIVRNKDVIKFNGVEIPPQTPCELQIRTLLQHAYSELTHDTVYKPKTRTIPEMLRIIARSMALIETTDELFGEVNDMLKTNSIENLLLPGLTTIYSSFENPELEKGLNIFILDSYKDLLSSVNVEDINTYLRGNPFIYNIIRKNYPQNLLYRQPIVLALYYLIATKRNLMKQHWPLTPALLQPLFTDLGYPF